MISIIISLFNKEKEIAKAIKSVLIQSFSNFELIIVNDGSTDKSSFIVKTFKDDRISFYTKENGGVSSARNFGINKAKFDLIAFLDGDDWWDPDFLEILIGLHNRFPDAGLYAGQYLQVNERNELITLDRFPDIEEGYFKLYENLYAVCSSSILVRKEVFIRCGFFDKNLTHGEDTDMWIRIAMNYNVCYTSKIVAFYNIGGNPLTRSIGKIPRLEQHLLSKLDTYIGKGLSEWDELLILKKAMYLKIFYIQYPTNFRVVKMIKSLPISLVHKSEYKLFKKPLINILCLHYQMILYREILRLRNLLVLKFANPKI